MWYNDNVIEYLSYNCHIDVTEMLQSYYKNMLTIRQYSSIIQEQIKREKKSNDIAILLS